MAEAKETDANEPVKKTASSPNGRLTGPHEQPRLDACKTYQTGQGWLWRVCEDNDEGVKRVSHAPDSTRNANVPAPGQLSRRVERCSLALTELKLYLRGGLQAAGERERESCLQERLGFQSTLLLMI